MSDINDYYTTAQLAKILDCSHEHARRKMERSDDAFKFKGAWLIPKNKVALSMLPKGVGRSAGDWDKIVVFDI